MPMGRDLSSGNGYLPLRLRSKAHTGEVCVLRHVHPGLGTKKDRGTLTEPMTVRRPRMA